MSGVIEFSQFAAFAIVTVALISAATDLACGKIYNWLTLPALVAGIVATSLHSGAAGAGSALLGALAGFLFFGWIFLLGFMGGGDVKVLMALGAWGGFRFTAETAVLSVFIGGALALLILLARGKIAAFGLKLHRFLLSVFIKELVLEPPKVDRKLTMPFGIPIAIAAVWVIVASPFSAHGPLGGFLPW